MLSARRTDWESTAWSSNGLLTPPVPELELTSDPSANLWDSRAFVKVETEEYLNSLHITIEPDAKHVPGLRSTPKKARYDDFLGAGFGVDLDTDPDLVAMRKLKNRYSNASLSPRVPFTPPLTPRPSVIAIAPIEKGEDEDGRWVECSAENDGDGPAIRGWSPPDGEKYVAVDISFEGLDPSLALPAGPGLASLPSLISCPATATSGIVLPKSEIGLGLNSAGVQSTGSQETICLGDTLRTPRASVVNSDMTKMDAKSLTSVSAAISHKEAEPITAGKQTPERFQATSSNTLLQEVQQMYSRRHGPTWIAQNVCQVAKRKRNAIGVFMPTNNPPTDHGDDSCCVPRSDGLGQTDNSQNTQRSHPILQPKMKLRSTTSGKGWTQGPSASVVETKPKARPLALLPPHLARSITRNAAAVLAQDCEKARNKALEEAVQSPMCFWSQKAKTLAGSPLQQSPTANQNESTPALPPIPTCPGVQKHSPDLPITSHGTLATPSTTSSSELSSVNCSSLHVLPQKTTSETHFPSRHLAIPVSMPAALSHRLGRTASDPDSQQLLRALATSVAQGFTQRGEVTSEDVGAKQDLSCFNNTPVTRDSESKAILSAICAWAAATHSHATSTSPSKQLTSLKRGAPEDDHERPVVKKIRVG